MKKCEIADKLTEVYKAEGKLPYNINNCTMYRVFYDYDVDKVFYFGGWFKGEGSNDPYSDQSRPITYQEAIAKIWNICSEAEKTELMMDTLWQKDGLR